MITHPFQILAPYKEEFDLRFLTKEDNVHNDAEIGTLSGAKRTVGLRQLHGSVVHVVREPSSRVLDGDGLVTDVPGLTLTIRFADCQGLVIYAPKHNVVGLIHAGWRGVVAGVIPSFFATLTSEWNIDPTDTFVGIGPSLCEQCADFSEPATEVPSLKEFTKGKHVDLRGAADAQLRKAGVQEANIERSSECTRCMPERYWTYRGGHREEVREGYVNCFAVELH